MTELEPMIDISAFTLSIQQSKIAPWQEFLIDAVTRRYQQYTHGEQQIWQKLLVNLPKIEVSDIELHHSVTIKSASPLSDRVKNQLIDCLKPLHPWRKGPFKLFDIEINTEWRSDWKWDRLLPHISPLKNRSILDVGCGNGYHCWRMLGQDPRLVLGIDPSQKFLAQFNVFQHYIGAKNCHFLPIGIEDMPLDMGNDGFDSVFCMGVLYHQKSPINLINHLKGLLNKGGELILETLVVDGNEQQVLVPHGRYAQMRNVWFLPSSQALEGWLKKCGFSSVKTVDINQTSTKEQRSTDWMTFHSLENYLDPADKNLTIEGHPAPKRAIIIATK